MAVLTGKLGDPPKNTANRGAAAGVSVNSKVQPPNTFIGFTGSNLLSILRCTWLLVCRKQQVRMS
jgi:hypothetical protein